MVDDDDDDDDGLRCSSSSSSSGNGSSSKIEFLYFGRLALALCGAAAAAGWLMVLDGIELDELIW